MIAALFESTIKQEAQQRQEISSIVATLRDRTNSLETELRIANTNLEKTNEDRARLVKELSTAQKELSDEKQLRGLDRTKQAGRFRGFHRMAIGSA